MTLNFAGLEFGGMGLAAIVGIIMNLILPEIETEKDEKIEKSEEIEENVEMNSELSYETN